MKYFIGVIIVMVAGGSYYWLTSSNSPKQDINIPIATSTQNTEPETVTKSNHQTYTNNDWGIAFEYPNDWEIIEPAFGSSVSLFNLSIDPMSEKKYPQSILINVTPKEWIVNALEKMKNRGVQINESYVDSYKSIKIEDKEMGIPTTSYLTLINDSYWIDISAKKGYETELNQVLDSITITPVEIPEKIPEQN